MKNFLILCIVIFALTVFSGCAIPQGIMDDAKKIVNDAEFSKLVVIPMVEEQIKAIEKNLLKPDLGSEDRIKFERVVKYLKEFKKSYPKFVNRIKKMYTLMLRFNGIQESLGLIKPAESNSKDSPKKEDKPPEKPEKTPENPPNGLRKPIGDGKESENV